MCVCVWGGGGRLVFQLAVLDAFKFCLKSSGAVFRDTCTLVYQK